MTETDAIPEPVKHARLPWTYLLGIMALAGYFWNNLGNVVTIIIFTTASRRNPEAAESLSEGIRWPTMIHTTFLLIVTTLLVLWIIYGPRLQQHRPRLTLALVTAAILSNFLGHLPLAYWMFVHGGR